MPIAKNLFDCGCRQLIATININFSIIYKIIEKIPKIECQKKDMVFDHASAKISRQIERNFLIYPKES
jgi:hypothetical protein